MGGFLDLFLVPLGYVVAHPFLALAPAAVFLAYFLVRRPVADRLGAPGHVRWSLLAGIVWLGYFFYELGMSRWSRGVAGAPIRVDLLLVGPILYLLTAVALWMAVAFELRARGRLTPSIPNPYSRSRDRAFTVRVAILLVSFPALDLLVLINLGVRDLRNKIIGLLVVLVFSMFLVLRHQWARWVLLAWLALSAFFSFLGWSSLRSTGRQDLASFKIWDLAALVIAVVLAVILGVSKPLKDYLAAGAPKKMISGPARRD